MKIIQCEDKNALGRRAAADGAALIISAIATQGHANLIVGTGASQFEMLAALVKHNEIDWSKVTAFHLDEYIGMPITHPASFRRYLNERFASLVELHAFHYILGENEPQSECQRVGRIIARCKIDVAFVGIGENGHLAFNDPPADFQTPEPFIVVTLDEACRRQQLGEGWFATLEDVPRQAITMSISQIMASKAIICSVPDERKASAVRAVLKGGVTPQVPASILRRHHDARIYLDPHSAAACGPISDLPIDVPGVELNPKRD